MGRNYFPPIANTIYGKKPKNYYPLDFKQLKPDPLWVKKYPKMSTFYPSPPKPKFVHVTTLAPRKAIAVDSNGRIWCSTIHDTGWSNWTPLPKHPDA